jgi:aspartate/methionine/tyrosine aminotransferase
MAQLCWELKKQGKDIVDLSLGEPDFDTPEHIRNAAKKQLMRATHIIHRLPVIWMCGML